MTSNQDSFDKAEQPSGASQPRLQKNTNALRDHWQNDVLPRLTPEIVYTDPSHRFQISPDRWRGGSPFRESKSGTSFAVWPTTLRFYDSGMGFAGDPITYIHSLKVGRWEHPKGKDWVEALRELSRSAGVEHLFPERSYSTQQVERAQKWEERRGIFAVVYTLCAEYLWSEQGVAVRSHLTEKRGFTENQLRDLKIGLYPTTALVEGTLCEQGFKIELALECGVLTRKWEGYVIFPWLTPHAEPLTMYGHWPASKADIPLKKDCPGWQKERDTAWKAWNKLTQAQKTETPWLEPQIPKKYACWNPKDESGSWLSTKESPLYFDRALKARHPDVVLVEGVTDAALAQSYGDTKVIACVAASLSKEQVQTLSRYRIERVNICLDPDLAGDKGIISCIKSLQAAGITPYVAPCLPKDSDGDGDPDRFIIKYGIEAWKQHTDFDNATHGFRWLARQIIATHGQENEQLSDAIRETILREASLFVSAVDKQHSEALATYFWPEIKQAVGTIQIIPTASDSIPVVASSTVSLLGGNDNSSRGGNSRRNNNNSRTSSNSHRKQNNGGDSGGGTNNGSSYNDEPWEDNDWDAPLAWNGEIGKWYKEDDGTFKFKPLTDFDFIITGEVMAAPGSDTGGGYLVKIKRSFESTEKEIFLKSLECLSVKNFTTAINQKFGVHLSCRLSQDQLVALIHERLKDYHVNRSGKTYRCIDRWGQQEDGTWVFANYQFKPNGVPTNQEESLWFYNPLLGAADHILPPEILPSNSTALRNLLEAQSKFAGSNFIYFLLCDGYVAASLHFQEILKIEKFFPILNPCGDPGSKKTVAVRSALSLAGWGDMEAGGLASITMSMAYERLKCLGSIPSLWDDPLGNKRQDKETLDEFMHRLYNGFPRQVRGNSQKPHSPIIPTTNQSLGETNPATKSRIIPLFMPVIKDGNRQAWNELRKACLQAGSAFVDLIKIGYPQEAVYAVRQRLEQHLPTAHERAADNLAPLVFYAQKVADLAGFDIDVEAWVIKNLCPTLNEGLTGLNSVTDFFDKLPALMSSNYVGSWNAEVVESREYGKVLALHLPSIWTEFDRQFSPAYNRPILERVLADMGAIKNKTAKLHSDRDQVLAYQRALLTVRYNEKGDAIFPNPPERINKKCLFVPERLWKSLNLDWLLEDDEPDDPSPGGGSPYNSPDPNDGNPSSGSPHSQTDIPDPNPSSSHQDSDEVTHSHQPWVTSYNQEQQSISPALSFASHQVTACSHEPDWVITRSCIPSLFFKETNFLELFVECSFLVTLVTLSALTLLSLDSPTFEQSPNVGDLMVTSCKKWVTCFRSGKLTQNYSSQLERLISASCKQQYV